MVMADNDAHQRIYLKREPRLDVKLRAYSFQAEALNALKDLEYGAIFHEQGLGKSKIAIDLMLYWLDKKQVDTVLFICKKGLIKNWQKEFDRHSFIKPKLLTNDRRSNYYVFNSPARVILTHYEILRSEGERFRLFLRARNVAVVLDESTKIKNPDASLTRLLFELSPLFKKRFIMTGTPVSNRPYDIWSQIYFLDQGNSLGEDFEEFKENTDLSNDLYNDVDAQERLERNLGGLFSKISGFAVRRTKDNSLIQLPQKLIHNMETIWENRQYDIYRQYQIDMRATIIKEGIPTQDNADDLLKRLLRLVQIASNPRLVDEGYQCTPGKLETLRDLVSSICSKHEKCIIWTSFVHNVDWLSLELRTFGACKVHGNLSIDKRNESIERFINAADERVLIATPSSAKEGLTLTIANHAIFYDRSFSLDDYLQAQDRIHRISQDKICHVYNLIMRDSIDEWVEVLLQAKHLAAMLSQGDISEQYYSGQMSYDFGSMIRSILDIDPDNRDNSRKDTA